MDKNLWRSLLIGGWVIFAVYTIKPAWAAINDWQKAASIVPRSVSDLSSDSAKASYRQFKEKGGNHLTFIIPLYQDNLYTTHIYRGWNTPTDSSLSEATNYAHSIGLKTSYKIHMESQTGEWRAFINPSNRSAWFESYGAWLYHYAQLAGDNGVAQMILGAELYDMTSSEVNSSNTDNWNKVIAGVRQRYGGLLTYSAQRGPDFDERSEIRFWDKLDYIGISGYYPLAKNNNNASVADYVASWQLIDGQYLAPMASQYGKSIIFAELGYRSLDGTHNDPWESGRGGSVDLGEQSDLYNAFFQYWSDKGYMKGIHIWDWIPDPEAGGYNNTGYTPQNKPAAEVISNWWSGGGEPQPSPDPGSNNHQISATINPNPATINQNVKVIVNVRSDGSASGKVVDIEIFNQNGVQIFQKYFEGQSWGTEGKTYEVEFITGQSGNYRVDVGIFNSGWSQMNIWGYSVANINVSGNATPTPQSPSPSPTAGATPSPSNTPALNNNLGQINIWWPADGSYVNGAQPFKAMVDNGDINQYKMYWQVDGGNLNEMGNSEADYPHKESWVDVSGWAWNNNGPYKINWIVKNIEGNTLSEKQVNIYISR